MYDSSASARYGRICAGGRAVHDRRAASDAGYRKRTNGGASDGPEVADPDTAPGEPAVCGIGTACDGTADHRYDVPDRKRRNSCDPGRIRNRKNNDPAPDCQMVRCGHYYLYRMRRAWK